MLKIFNRKLLLTTALAVVLIFASGCSLSFKRNAPRDFGPEIPAATSTPQKTDLLSKLKEQSKMKQFASEDELVRFLSKNVSSSGYSGGIFRNTLAMRESSVGSMKSLAAPAVSNSMVSQGVQADSGADDDFSKTNTQVEGVDEADIVKSDGKYIYAVSHNSLKIISALPPADMKIVSSVEVSDSQPSELFVSGNRLAIFGQGYGQHLVESASAKCVAQGIAKCEAQEIVDRSLSFVKVYDITDRANPKLMRELAFDGNYQNSRLIGDTVYLLTSKHSYEPADILPRIWRSRKLVAPGTFPVVHYFDMPYRSTNFTTLTAFNIKDDAIVEKSETYLLPDTRTIYVSNNNFYLTYTKYLDEQELMTQVMIEVLSPRLSQKDKALFEKIEGVDETVLTPVEKMAKKMAVLERLLDSLPVTESDELSRQFKENARSKYNDLSQELEKTVVHKIAISPDKLEYKGFGEVLGSVLNQFSLDEQGGYLRLATTKNRSWSQFLDDVETESYSNLYVLDESLKQVGAVEKLAKGEKIYSVRFVDKRAYVVTFKQTDPLFVIDLSDQTAPKVLGELKIPGFSNYLHPYDENKLIGFGKDTSENSNGGVITGGLKLSLFDVSQVDKPQELDNFILGDRGSDSIALTNHRAFLFSKEKNILAVPVSLYKSASKDEWGKFAFGGLAVFKIENNKFVNRGQIDHSDNGKIGENYYFDNYAYYDNNVLRSLYIGETLFSLSGRYLKANSLTDLAEIKALSLKVEATPQTVSTNKSVITSEVTRSMPPSGGGVVSMPSPGLVDIKIK